MSTTVEKTPCKVFPHTFGGDQLRIGFDYRQEGEAFLGAVEKLQQAILARHAHGKWKTKREKPLKGFSFDTTLQALVAAEHEDAIKKIVGLSELRIRGKDEVTVIPLPIFTQEH